MFLRAGFGQQIADRAWSAYQHEFAGNASRSARTAADIDFDSPLMRLAAGGVASATDTPANGASHDADPSG